MGIWYSVQILKVIVSPGCVIGSACGMDKDVMKRLFLSHGVPTPKHVALGWDEIDGSLAGIETMIRYPAFVKLANLGSSVGIGRATNQVSLKAALHYAAEFDDKVIVEPAIEAREIECGVLGNEDPEVSVPGEIVTHGGFYDYETKYIADTADLVVPAPLSDIQRSRTGQLAVKAYQALGCAGLARVELLLDRKTGGLSVNEVNPMPGFTSISMYPRMWGCSGVPYPALVERLIDLAFERHSRGRRVRFDCRLRVVGSKDCPKRCSVPTFRGVSRGRFAGTARNIRTVLGICLTVSISRVYHVHTLVRRIEVDTPLKPTHSSFVDTSMPAI